VKHPDAAPDGVDEYLPVLLERARFETRVVGPHQLAELLDGGPALP
jgi:hypothetical protein